MIGKMRRLFSPKPARTWWRAMVHVKDAPECYFMGFHRNLQDAKDYVEKEFKNDYMVVSYDEVILSDTNTLMVFGSQVDPLAPIDNRKAQ
jgi:intein-encoded DNA endonuclease-like protein